MLYWLPTKLRIAEGAKYKVLVAFKSLLARISLPIIVKAP